MAASDYVSDVESAVADGMQIKMAIDQVAARQGVSRSGLQTAYYRRRTSTPKRKTRARRPPVRGAFTPPAMNGHVSTEELLARLRLNREEHDQIMSQLESAVAEDVATLARVRGVLHA